MGDGKSALKPGPPSIGELKDSSSIVYFPIYHVIWEEKGKLLVITTNLHKKNHYTPFLGLLETRKK